jgi:hypothetical protein
MSLVNLLQIFRAVGVREEVSEKKYSHRLLHMYPRHEDQHEYRGFFLDFASEEIANKIYDRMVEKCFEKLTEFIVANEEDANTGGFRGTLFEIFCHRMWLNIGIATLEGKLLDSDGQDRKFLIEVPNKVDSCRFSDLIEIPP